MTVNPDIATLNETFQKLAGEYGYVFLNTALLQEALTHTTYEAECAEVHNDNQRLEFLGDAVLQMILTEHLYRELPDMREGILTRVRSMLACEETLSKFALRIGLDKMLLMGHGENQSGGRERPSILCDVFESVLGAVYLDGGYAAARQYCMRFLPPVKAVVEQLGQRENPKGYLQELCQGRHWPKPEYVQTERGGTAHEPVFTFECIVNEKVSGLGVGHSIREAQKAAAVDAIRRVFGDGEGNG